MAQRIKDTTSRAQEITERYLAFIERHVEAVTSGDEPDFLELNEIASTLAVSHTHLTDTVQKELGHHPCHYYDAKIIEKAKAMLLESDRPIAQVAMMLTYDPSNFSKFFKKWTGMTPGAFRKLPKSSP